MDEHVQRVCAPLTGGWDDFVVGRANLADLSRLAGQARGALDSSSAPLPDLLWRAELELLAMYDDGRESDHAAARHYLDPVFEMLEHGA